MVELSACLYAQPNELPTPYHWKRPLTCAFAADGTTAATSASAIRPRTTRMHPPRDVGSAARIFCRDRSNQKREDCAVRHKSQTVDHKPLTWLVVGGSWTHPLRVLRPGRKSCGTRRIVEVQQGVGVE